MASTTLLTIFILTAASTSNAIQIIKADFFNTALEFVNDKTNFLKHHDLKHANVEGDKPAFCNGLDCPSYKLMEKKEVGVHHTMFGKCPANTLRYIDVVFMFKGHVEIICTLCVIACGQ